MPIQTVPKKVLVHRQGRAPYFATRYTSVFVPSAVTTKKIRVIPASSYKGSLIDLYSRWLKDAQSFGEDNFKHLMVPVVGLQDVIFKKYRGFLAVLGDIPVGVLSLETDEEDLDVSVVSPSPKRIMSGHIQTIQDLLIREAQEYAFEKGVPLKGVPESLSKSDDSVDASGLDKLTFWLNKQAELGKPPRPGLVPESGDPRHPYRWVRPEKGQTKTSSGLPIPPAWTDVQINPDPKGDVQAFGYDSKGRKQTLYSVEYSKRQSAKKFKRLKAFDKVLPGIRKKIAKDLNSLEEAQILYLIDATAFRIGSNSETRAAHKAYGMSTMLGRHVSVVGNKVHFDFIGKKGVRIQKTISDPTAASIIRSRKAGDEDPLFSVSERDVRKYLGRVSKGPFLVKDFRTWHGTDVALSEIGKLPVPSTKKEFKKSRKRVAEVVAAHLGNTPAVSLGSYIQPEVFRDWEAAVGEVE